jgi:Domain of unknown function (DUF6265)
MTRARWLRWITLCGIVSLSAPAGAQAPPVRATVSRLAWLAGTWQGDRGPLTFEEQWTPPAGGAMLAVARTLKGDRMVAFEFLRIVERDGSLVYIAQPNGRPPTEFALTGIAADTATFENPAHDFPKVIRYTRRQDGTLEARVSDGATRAETFVFRRGHW